MSVTCADAQPSCEKRSRGLYHNATCPQRFHSTGSCGMRTFAPRTSALSAHPSHNAPRATRSKNSTEPEIVAVSPVTARGGTRVPPAAPSARLMGPGGHQRHTAARHTARHGATWHDTGRDTARHGGRGSGGQHSQTGHSTVQPLPSNISLASALTRNEPPLGFTYQRFIDQFMLLVNY